MIWFFLMIQLKITALVERILKYSYQLPTFLSLFCFLIGILCDLCINGHICLLQIEEKRDRGSDLTTELTILPGGFVMKNLLYSLLSFFWIWFSGFHARLNRLPGAAARCLRKGRRRLVGKVFPFAR